MESVIEMYNDVLHKIRSINEKIKRTEQTIASKKTDHAGSSAARIAKLEEQIAKIEEYLPRIQGFQELAKKNLESQNVLTIEAPPGYRVNLNRLRNWAMLIDPTASNDPYAQRVYVVAKCDEFFLNKKKEEFTARIAELKEDQSIGLSAELSQLEKELVALHEELKNYAMSPEISDFLNAVVKASSEHWYETSPAVFANVKDTPAAIAPGAYLAPLKFDKEQCQNLKGRFGRLIDADGARVALPAEIKFKTSSDDSTNYNGEADSNEFVMTVTCSPVRSKELDRGLQNLVLNLINKYPAGLQKVYVLDGLRFNSMCMGSLKKLEDTFAMAQIPRNPDQLTATLEEIVSSFSDMDEMLELRDSVDDYNRAVNDPSKWLPFTTIILYGWPNSYEGRDKELLQRIMTNYERYGISFITVTYRNSEKKEDWDKNVLPEYAMHNAIHISMLQKDNQKDTTICFANSKPQSFTWYIFSGELSDEYASSLKDIKLEKEAIGNEYTKRYSLIDRPEYVRDYKKIELPFGIDGKDTAHSVSFENENFATYLVGASRSGKSTLLHTLIAGLIRNYHPDNVELWLADFKQLEFKRYINHLPPHVKYVLLDESTELVFDLIDKLTNEMMERQKLFSRLGVQRIDQVKPMELDKPLPVIFVILDEFSIMSQSIAESPIYKLRLQNILAKGAALGIKFLFSSQTFTTGVAGLTATARAQIQQRIAMKGSKEEISEMLELSSNLKTEQVRNWMDALPPHYALVKFRLGADTLPQVKRYLVMYFEDYAPRDQMIDQIKNSMQPIEGYNPSDIRTYSDKHPVLVDGNTYDSFDNDGFTSHLNSYKEKLGADYSGDEVLATFGTPRLMERMKISALSAETRENILLISRAAEQACATSIMISTIKSFKNQGVKVQVWAYDKNRLFKAYRQLFVDQGIQIVVGMEDICVEIKKLKESIVNGEVENKLIVLIGMDRICVDFDYIDDEPSSQEKKNSYSDAIDKGRVQSEDDRRKIEIINAFAKEWAQIEPQLVEEGKTNEEIAAIKKERRKEFVSKNYVKPKDSPMQAELKNDYRTEKTQTNKAYNAKLDFEFVIKQGSRFGRHFLLNLNSFADLRATGLKLEFFRYKMAFQLSVDDSRSIFNSKIASTLPEHICQFDDTLESYSFRPFLHEGIEWDGWYVEDGKVVSPYEDNED